MGPNDLRLGQIVYILVFYNITFSWLLPLDGFQFNFLLRDSENDLYTIKFFFGLIKNCKKFPFTTLAFTVIKMLGGAKSTRQEANTRKKGR